MFIFFPIMQLTHWRERKRNLRFLKYVDGAVFSCEVKQIKPEPEIYKTLLERYHLEPEKSVFLDDQTRKL